MSDPQIPYGVTFFCDDIREEVGGKFSYIGVYSDKLQVVGEAPVVLSKLCAAVRFMIPHELNILHVRLIVNQVNENETLTLVEQNINLEEEKDSSGTYVSIIAHHVISPFVLNENTILKVRAFIGDKKIKLGALSIAFVSPK